MDPEYKRMKINEEKKEQNGVSDFHDGQRFLKEISATAHCENMTKKDSL